MENIKNNISTRFLNHHTAKRNSCNMPESKKDKHLSTDCTKRLSLCPVSKYNDMNDFTTKYFKRSSSYWVARRNPLHLSDIKESKILPLERASSCHLPRHSSQDQLNTKESTKSKLNYSLRQPKIRTKLQLFSSQSGRKDSNHREEFDESSSSRSLTSFFSSLSCFFRKSNQKVLGKVKLDEVYSAKENSLSYSIIS